MDLPKQNILLEDDLCKSCQEKVKKKVAKLNYLSLIAPHRIASKFLKLLCKDCRQRCISKVRGGS